VSRVEDKISTLIYAVQRLSISDGTIWLWGKTMDMIWYDTAQNITIRYDMAPKRFSLFNGQQSKINVAFSVLTDAFARVRLRSNAVSSHRQHSNAIHNLWQHSNAYQKSSIDRFQ